jgi:glycosyltransferase involved in cell wall biosynthesis
MFGSFARRRRALKIASTPEVALLISTYHKPRHLKLVLASVAVQQGVDGKLEVVVTDDGSTDETIEIVERFAQTVDFPVKLTTHRHRAFQVSRCRNEGVAASSAPYIVILDGDCLVPRNFVLQHLRRRKRRVVMNGDCFRLQEDVSACIDESTVRSGEFVDLPSPAERMRVHVYDREARWHYFIHHRTKPHLLGGHIGVWRSDYERVNGFDEAFQGWGGEDDDLGYRFRQAKIRIQSIVRWTQTYHVWHSRDASCPAVWHDGPNVARVFRKNRATRCVNGLIKLDSTEAEREYADPPFGASDETRVIDFSHRESVFSMPPQERIAA